MQFNYSIDVENPLKSTHTLVILTQIKMFPQTSQSSYFVPNHDLSFNPTKLILCLNGTKP